MFLSIFGSESVPRLRAPPTQPHSLFFLPLRNLFIQSQTWLSSLMHYYHYYCLMTPAPSHHIIMWWSTMYILCYDYEHQEGGDYTLGDSIRSRAWDKRGSLSLVYIEEGTERRRLCWWGVVEKVPFQYSCLILPIKSQLHWFSSHHYYLFFLSSSFCRALLL
jgi:hypothetical protein